MRILHVYHSMSYGGVARYLLTLSAELQRRGHVVIVAAPRGVFTERLQEAGVRFIEVGLADRALLFSSRALRSAILEERIEIVCAHDYSAGAAAYLASRETATPYLLTIHARRPCWQRWVVFYWSKQIVVVSPSLRDDLTQLYHVAPERVLQSSIGIDTQRFQPQPAEDGLKQEFGIASSAPVILHISRLSKTKSHTSTALVTLMPDLMDVFPELKLLIVGDGEDLEKVQRLARKVNANTAIAILGGRGDVGKFFSLATVVVGTATVALESMAAGRPVVASGKFGFGGIIRPENFDGMYHSLFGDHSAPQIESGQSLRNSIVTLLQNEGLRQELGNWGRQVVSNRFSVERVADQMEQIYADSIRTGVPHYRTPAAARP